MIVQPSMPISAHASRNVIDDPSACVIPQPIASTHNPSALQPQYAAVSTRNAIASRPRLKMCRPSASLFAVPATFDASFGEILPSTACVSRSAQLRPK